MYCVDFITRVLLLFFRFDSRLFHLFLWLKFSFFSWSRSLYHDVVAFSLLLRFLLHVAAAFNFFTTIFLKLFLRFFVNDILNVDFQTDECHSVAKHSVDEIANMRVCFLFDFMKFRNIKILSVRILKLEEFHERNERNWKRILKREKCFKTTRRITFRMTIDFENWYLTSREQYNFEVAESKKFKIVRQLLYTRENFSCIDC